MSSPRSGCCDREPPRRLSRRDPSRTRVRRLPRSRSSRRRSATPFWRPESWRIWPSWTRGNHSSYRWPMHPGAIVLPSTDLPDRDIFRMLADGAPTCLTVTLVDGLVLALRLRILDELPPE